MKSKSGPILLTLLLVFIPSSCTTVSEYSINRDQAITIALNQLPEPLAERAGASTLYDEDTWHVAFMFSGPNTFTGEELGWEEGPGTEFKSSGIFPEGSYTLISIDVDRRNGDIVSRLASDSVLLGGPGVWDNEPPEEQYIPVWAVVFPAVGGIILGALMVWLILRRKKAA